jgi:hypothetical protein
MVVFSAENPFAAGGFVYLLDLVIETKLGRLPQYRVALRSLFIISLASKKPAPSSR